MDKRLHISGGAVYNMIVHAIAEQVLHIQTSPVSLINMKPLTDINIIIAFIITYLSQQDIGFLINERNLTILLLIGYKVQLNYTTFIPKS